MDGNVAHDGRRVGETPTVTHVPCGVEAKSVLVDVLYGAGR